MYDLSQLPGHMTIREQVCSQHCNPSSRGRPGTRLCPLVLAPLRVTEGKLTWRGAERCSPETSVHHAAPCSLTFSTPGELGPLPEPACSEQNKSRKHSCRLSPECRPHTVQLHIFTVITHNERELGKRSSDYSASSK